MSAEHPAATVYAVMEEEGMSEGPISTLCSLWDTEDAARAECERLTATTPRYLLTKDKFHIDSWELNNPDGGPTYLPTRDAPPPQRLPSAHPPNREELNG